MLEILAPWGPAVEDRPPVLSEVDRFNVRQEKRERKVERRRRKLEGEEEGSEGGEGASEGELVAAS